MADVVTFADPTVASNILAMPFVIMSVTTGTNEDWIDSIKYVVDDGGGDPDDMPQLDLNGIVFFMEVRRTVEDKEVVIRASSQDGTLDIGDSPNFGYFFITIEHSVMKYILPGTYIADVVGIDAAGVERRLIEITLNLVEGITRP